jgi:hypothetical protein
MGGERAGDGSGFVGGAEGRWVYVPMEAGYPQEQVSTWVEEKRVWKWR